MSYQVGASCYPTVADAAVAACAAYSPTSSTSGGSSVLSASCDHAEGSNLILRVVSSPIDGSLQTSKFISQTFSYPDCVQADYVAAGELVFAAILLSWSLIFGLNKIRSYLDWSRQND